MDVLRVVSGCGCTSLTLEAPPGLLRSLFRFQRESSGVYCKTCISCLYLAECITVCACTELGDGRISGVDTTWCYRGIDAQLSAERIKFTPQRTAFQISLLGACPFFSEIASRHICALYYFTYLLLPVSTFLNQLFYT